MSVYKSSKVAALALLFSTATALAADLGGKGSDPTSASYVDYKSWTGPSVAILGGYSIATVTTEDSDPLGLSIEGGFVEGQIGYDYQIGRFVIGSYVCASYSAIEGLADGYCVNARGGYLLNRDTLLFGNVGWRLQGTDGEGEDSVYAAGPVLGGGVESRLSENASVLVGFERHWITSIDGETVPDGLNLGDNRIKSGIVFRY